LVPFAFPIIHKVSTCARSVGAIDPLTARGVLPLMRPMGIAISP
jgi:hypothetical protein